MALVRDKSRSYSGRQVDLELLKHVEDPAYFTELRNVTPTVSRNPRIVAGIEKSVQRYAKLFLTRLGSSRLDRSVGNNLLSEIALGRVGSIGYLKHISAAANASALSALRIDDGNPGVFGNIPDDERIVKAVVNKTEVERDPLSGGRIRVGVAITTAAGDNYTFIIPIEAGVA